MNHGYHICESCFEKKPEIGVDDDGVGGNHYGSSYSFHTDLKRVTVCCGSTLVLVFEDELAFEDALTEGRLREEGEWLLAAEMENYYVEGT